jgi:lipoate-protein ligase A
MDFNTEEMKKVFNSSDRLSDLHEIDTMIRLAPSVTVRELRSAVKKGFEDVFGIRLLSGDPTEIELRLAETLVTEKYSQERWNSRR